MKYWYRKHCVLILCFAAYSLVYTGRMNLSVASPLLEAGAILNKVQIGILGSIFFAIYAAGRIVNGIICDRVKPKPFLVSGMLLSGVCNVCISFLPPVGFIYVFWGMNGFFQSMLWGAALKNVSSACNRQEESKQAAMVLSISVGVGTLLGIIVPAVLALVGLQHIFLIPGIILITFSSLLIILLPSSADSDGIIAKQNTAALIKNPIVLKMLVPAAAHGAIKENLTLWIPLLFMDMYGLDLANAAAYIFMMPVATLIGRLIFPYCYKLCGNDDIAILMVSFGICAVFLLPFLAWQIPVWLGGILLAMVSVTTSLMNTELISIYPVSFQSSNQISAVSGVLDSFTYVGSAIGSAAFGYIIQACGYRGMLAVWAALAFLSLGIIASCYQRNRQAENC